MQHSKLVSLVAASIMGMGSLSAQAQSGSYVNAQVALAQVSGFDSGTALALTYGQNLPVVSSNFFIEGELTTSLSKPSQTYYFFNDKYTAEVSYFTGAAYAVYAYPFTNQFSLRGRAGLLYESVDAEVSGPGGSASASNSDVGLSLGAGATYAFNPKMALIAEYTMIESDLDHISAGIQYRF